VKSGEMGYGVDAYGSSARWSYDAASTISYPLWYAISAGFTRK
jgi:hypothetical protein